MNDHRSSEAALGRRVSLHTPSTCRCCHSTSRGRGFVRCRIVQTTLQTDHLKLIAAECSPNIKAVKTHSRLDRAVCRIPVENSVDCKVLQYNLLPCQTWLLSMAMSQVDCRHTRYIRDIRDSRHTNSPWKDLPRYSKH